MPLRPASSHRLTFVLIGLIVLGLGAMVYVMRTPTVFRGSLPPTQTTRPAGIIISGSQFISLPTGSTATMYIAGIDRDRTTNKVINGIVQTEDILTDGALPSGATLNRCIYTGYFGATPIQVNMYCLTYAPTNADIGNHAIVLRAKEYDTGLPSDSPLTVTYTVTGNSTADLGIRLKSGPLSARPGEQVRYSFEVWNSGPEPATYQMGFAGSTSYPITFAGAENATCSITSNPQGICGSKTIAPGEFQVISLLYNVSQTASCGSTFKTTGVLNLVSTTDPYFGNNAAGAPFASVDCGSSSSSSSFVDVAVDSDTFSDSSQVTVGGSLAHSILIGNHGSSPANNVRVSIPLPTGFTLRQQSSAFDCAIVGSSVVCPIGSLPANSVGTLRIGLDPIDQSSCGTNVTSQVTVTSDEPDANTGNNQGPVVQAIAGCVGVSSSSSSSPVADFTVSYVSPFATVQRGATVLYQLRVTNNGPSTGSYQLASTMGTGNALIFDGSPDGCSLVVPTSNQIICPTRTLAAGASEIVMMSFIISESAACYSTFPLGATVSAASGTTETIINNNNTTIVPDTTIDCSSNSSSSSSVALAFCGDGIVNGAEECDDGKQCAQFGTACTTNADCTGGQTCQTWDGDGCFANCSLMFPPDSIFP